MRQRPAETSLAENENATSMRSPRSFTSTVVNAKRSKQPPKNTEEMATTSRGSRIRTDRMEASLRCKPTYSVPGASAMSRNFFRRRTRASRDSTPSSAHWEGPVLLIRWGALGKFWTADRYIEGFAGGTHHPLSSPASPTTPLSRTRQGKARGRGNGLPAKSPPTSYSQQTRKQRYADQAQGRYRWGWNVAVLNMVEPDRVREGE